MSPSWGGCGGWRVTGESLERRRWLTPSEKGRRRQSGGLAGPPCPGLWPGWGPGPQQGACQASAHSTGPPGSQIPLPIPWRRKHTRQPSSAHLWEWALGVTLMPGREWTPPGMPRHPHGWNLCESSLPPSSFTPNPARAQAHPTCTTGQPGSWLQHLGPHLGNTFLGKRPDPGSRAGEHLDLQAHTHRGQGRLEQPLPLAVLRTVSSGWTQAGAEAPDSAVALRERRQPGPGLARPGYRERELRLGDGGRR